MEIITITDGNLSLLEEFLKEDIPDTFRYFNTRPVSIIGNHITTILCLDGRRPVGYGHIDREGKENWIGLCVIDSYQGRGIGRNLISNLIKYADENRISELSLTVDKMNERAINLYKSLDFFIIGDGGRYWKMIRSASICVMPVSIGEAIDKLTILDIKLEKILDERRRDVEAEWQILRARIGKYEEYYYRILREVNSKIWDQQDEFRGLEQGSKRRQELCEEIIIENDRRFRIKNLINTIGSSKIREQKGYGRQSAVIVPHQGIGDHFSTNGLVRFIYTHYDSVILIVTTYNRANIERQFSDLNLTYDEAPHSMEEIYRLMEKYRLKGMTIYALGEFRNIRDRCENIPLCFYDCVKLPRSIYWSYFHIPRSSKEEEIWDLIRERSYVVVHNKASNGVVFRLEDALKCLGTNKDETLVLNPVESLYSEGHPYYEISRDILGGLVADYRLMLEGATGIVLCDSSFLSMGFNLELRSDKNYYVGRGGRRYDYLWSDQPVGLNRKRFEYLNIGLI